MTASESAVDGLPDGRPRRRDEILAAAVALFAEEGYRNGELNAVADPALVASCVRELMWAPMRSLAPVSPSRVRDFCRRSILAGSATPS